MRPRTPNTLQHEDVPTTSSSTHILQQQPASQPHSEDEIDCDDIHCSCHIEQVVALSSDVSSESPEVDEDAHPQHRRRRRRRRCDTLNDENDVDDDDVEDVDYPTATNIQPPINVPQPQIQSDSKKTSSPRRYRYNTNRIFKATLLIHLFSLFACTASTRFVRSHEQSTEKSYCKGFKFSPEQVQHRYNETFNKCLEWSDDLIDDICNTPNSTRNSTLSEIYLFHEYQPLSLFEIFSAGDLKLGELGTDCVFESGAGCRRCFIKFNETVGGLKEAFQSFDSTLSRFDCLPATNTSTATRPFSPNATCDNCKLWYRRWLFVQKLNVWKNPPCINWCYYTQLACPHLAPFKVWDYAGHPSFQCRDMDIDSWRQECDCVHPCDVKSVVPPGDIGNAPSIRHDFFAAEVHCTQRRKECHKPATKSRSPEKPPPITTTTTTTTISPTTTTTSSSTTDSISTSASTTQNSWTTPRLLHYFLLILLWML